MKRDIFQKRVNFKPFEYPELEQYKNAIRHSYWIHTEFNITSDIQDYKVNINDVERDIIKKTMLAISQIEVSVKAFWAKIYDRMPKPEVALVGMTFAESEARHSDAYSFLLEQLGLNKEFETLHEVPAIMDRINYLEKYISGAKSRDDKRYAMSLLLFSIFIEHISLFSQFLIMMSFNKHKNLFKGISNIVEATSKEEDCLIPNTEILTLKGWLKVQDLKIGDDVFQYDMTNGLIQNTKVLSTISKDYNGVMHKFNKRGKELVCTDGHRFVYYNHLNQIKEKDAGSFKGDSKKFIPEVGFTDSKDNTPFTDDDILKIIIQADGTYKNWTNSDGDIISRGKSGGYNISVGLTKERKKERLIAVLENLSINYSTIVGKENEVIYSFNYDYGKNYKNFDWVDLSKNKDWMKSFCKELMKWDGFEVSDNTFGYSNTNKSSIDKAQCIGVLAGYTTSIYIKKDNRKESYKDCYKLYFRELKTIAQRSHSLKKESFNYNGLVHCISVPSGVIITRNNDNTFITGNCHGKFGLEIINILKDEHPEWFDEQFNNDIINACIKAEKAEVKILDWIYEKGELDFLPKSIVLNFIKNRFNNSLVSIGLSPIFDVNKEELLKTKWFDEEVTSTKDNDFFNKRSTTYSKKQKSITEDDLF
jgi:ribonucleotide reductase beta subunit family protein with ferritin-like domain